MGTPYYAEKKETKTASLISTSGSSSSSTPKKTTSKSSSDSDKRRDSDSGSSSSRSYSKVIGVEERFDYKGEVTSRKTTTSVTSGGRTTSSGSYTKIKEKEVIRPGAKPGTGGVSKRTTQKKETPKAYELEGLLAQAGPSPDHPAYVSSQRYMVPGTNAPLYIADINLPPGEGRRLIEQRLEEAYGKSTGYETAQLQLDKDPELERVYYPEGFLPKGAKITGGSIEKVKIEQPSISDLSKTLSSAEVEYEKKKREEQPAVSDYISSLGLDVELPSAYVGETTMFVQTGDKKKVSPFFEPVPSNFPIDTDTKYLYYTEDYPGYKGKGMFLSSKSPTATPETSQILGMKQDWMPSIFDAKFKKQMRVKGWIADADEPKLTLQSGLVGEYSFTREELKNIASGRGGLLLPLAIQMNLPDEKTGLTPKQEALKPKDTFTQNLAAWDVAVEKHPLLGGLSTVGRFTSEGIRKQFGFKGNKPQDLLTGYVSGGLETLFGVGEFGGKVAGRLIIPVTTAYETGDVGKTAGEVWRSYSAYPAVFAASVGEIGLIGTKDPGAAGVLGSYILGSAVTLKITGEGVAMGATYVKERLSKPSFSAAKAKHFVTKVDYKELSARGLSKAETYTEIGKVKVRGDFGGSMYLKEVNKPQLFATEDFAMQAKGAIVEAGVYKMTITRPRFFGLLGTETKTVYRPITSSSLISPSYTAPDIVGGFDYNAVLTSAKMGKSYYTSYNIGKTTLEVDTKMRVSGWAINRPVDWKQELSSGWTTHISMGKGGVPSHLWAYKQDIPVFKQTNFFAGQTGKYATYEISSVYNPFSRVTSSTQLDKPIPRYIPSPHTIQETPKYDIQGTLFKSMPSQVKASGYVSAEQITGVGTTPSGTVQAGKLVTLSKVRTSALGSTLTQSSVDTAIQYSSAQFGKEAQAIFSILTPPRPPQTQSIQITTPKTTNKQASFQPIIQVAGQKTPQKSSILSVQKEQTISKELYKMNTVLKPVGLSATKNISSVKQPTLTKQITSVKQITPGIVKQTSPQKIKVVPLTKLITPGISLTVQKRPPTNINFKFASPPPPPPTFIIPKIPLIAGDELYSKKSGKRGYKTSVYAGKPPSFTALLGNIRGKKISKKSLISGVGVRPITKGWFGKQRRII